MRFKKTYYVYILCNEAKTVLYIGVTNNLSRRLKEHLNPEPGSKSFTSRYKVNGLIYFEKFNWPNNAIRREKELKGWSRAKKEALIESKNPEWSFLNDEFL